MTIDTIKEVLGRIISINKNLNESSLKNLLIASGWDDHDIEEGLRVFRDYYNIKNPEPAKLPEVKQVVNVIVEPKKEEPKPEDKKEERVEEKVQKSEIKINTFDLLEEDKKKKEEEEKKKEETKPVVTILPKIEVKKDEKTTESCKEEEYEKPWGLIVLDVILFLITLGLLIYIIIH